MDTLSYKTISANKSTVKRKWYLIDAKDQILGRLATKIAIIIRGKNKPDFTPHVNCGDHVVVINADKIKLTGNKMTDKEYVSYSNYPGGQKRITPQALLKKKPTAVVEKAVRGMLPKNKLGRVIFKNMLVYSDSTHPHQSKKPIIIKL